MTINIWKVKLMVEFLSFFYPAVLYKFYRKYGSFPIGEWTYNNLLIGSVYVQIKIILARLPCSQRWTRNPSGQCEGQFLGHTEVRQGTCPGFWIFPLSMSWDRDTAKESTQPWSSWVSATVERTWVFERPWALTQPSSVNCERRREKRVWSQPLSLGVFVMKS